MVDKEKNNKSKDAVVDLIKKIDENNEKTMEEYANKAAEALFDKRVSNKSRNNK